MLNVNNFQNGDTYSGCEMCGNSEKTVWENGFGFYCDECKDKAIEARVKKFLPFLVKVSDVETDEKKIKIFNGSVDQLKMQEDDVFICPGCSSSFIFVKNQNGHCNSGIVNGQNN